MPFRLNLNQFQKDTSGTVAFVFALSILLLLGAIGLAIDSSRAVHAKTQLQAALDAAALAAARRLNDETASDDDLVAIARRYFEAHRSSIRVNELTYGEADVSVDRENSIVIVGVKARLPSTFGNLGGIDPEIELNPTAQTKFKSKKIEISLVVDITGSMGENSRIEGLKIAAKDLIATLADSNPDTGAIRLSLVPYASSVNAGGYKSRVAGTLGTDECVVERFGPEQSTDAPPGLGNYLGTDLPAVAGSYACVAGTEIELLSDISKPDERSRLETRVEDLSIGGSTAGHIGLSWGWYLLSANWSSIWPSDKRPRPSGPDVIKAVILMTDGDFNTQYDVKSSSDQALATCENILNDSAGIKIFTIGFQAPPTALEMLKTCSGEDNFFDASNTSSLVDSFREIAKRLTSLRLSS